MAYGGMGRIEDAFRAVDAAIEGRGSSIYLAIDNVFAPLRQHDAYARALERLGMISSRRCSDNSFRG